MKENMPSINEILEDSSEGIFISILFQKIVKQKKKKKQNHFKKKKDKSRFQKKKQMFCSIIKPND